MGNLGAPLVGLALHSAMIRVAVIRDGLVLRIAEQPLPRGTIADGFLEDAGQLTAALKELWLNEPTLPREVNFSVFNADTRFTPLSLQYSTMDSEDDIRLLTWNAAIGLLGTSKPKRAIVDYAEQGRSVNRIELELHLAEREAIEPFFKAVSAAKLQPIACEIGPLAATRALRIPRDPDGLKASAIIDIGAEVTSFVVASGFQLLELRQIPLGGNDLSQAVMARLGCSYSEAQEIASQVGFSDHPELVSAVSGGSEAQEAMSDVIERLMQRLADEKRNFESSANGRQIEALFLIGPGSRLPGVSQLFSLAGMPTPRPLIPRAGFEPVPDLDLYATAVGLANRPEDDKAVSLVPVSRRRGNIIAPKLQYVNLRQAERRLNTSAARSVSSVSSGNTMIAFALGLLMIVLCWWEGGRLALPPAPAQVGPAIAQPVQIQYSGPNATQSVNTIAGYLNDQGVVVALNQLAGWTSPSSGLSDITINWSPGKATISGIAASTADIQSLVSNLTSVSGFQAAISGTPTQQATGGYTFVVEVTVSAE